MADYVAQLLAFHAWAVIAALAAIATLFSMVADRRRQRRASLDKVGFMPWTAISLFSTGLTLVSVALAIKTW